MFPEVLEEDLAVCPNPQCNRELQDDWSCGACGECFERCCFCGATTRLLSNYCRCCGRLLDWPRVHAEWGLQAAPSMECPNLEPVWNDDLNEPVSAAPLLVGGLVVLAAGRLLLKSLSTGKTLAEHGASVRATPAICGQQLVFSTVASTQSLDLYSFLRGAPKMLWECDASSFKPISVAEERIVLVESVDGSAILTLLHKSGERAGSILVSTNSRVSAPIYLAGKLVQITGDGRVLWIDLEPKLIDSRHIGQALDVNTLSVSTDSFYFAAVDGQVWRGKIDNGLELERFGATAGLLVNSTSCSQDYLAVAHGAGLLLLDRYGDRVWETALDGYSLTATFAAGSYLMAVDDTGTLFNFDYRDCVPRSRVRLFQPTLVLPPVVSPHNLVYVEKEGKIRAFRFY